MVFSFGIFNLSIEQYLLTDDSQNQQRQIVLAAMGEFSGSYREFQTEIELTQNVKTNVNKCLQRPRQILREKQSVCGARSIESGETLLSLSPKGERWQQCWQSLQGGCWQVMERGKYQLRDTKTCKRRKEILLSYFWVNAPHSHAHVYTMFTVAKFGTNLGVFTTEEQAKLLQS